MSIVVVEGVDGSGKTTLIDQLRQASIRHFVTLSRSGPPRAFEEIQSVLRWMEHGSSLRVPLVCDRHPLVSEPIYGNTLRGFSLLDRTRWSENASKYHFIDCIERVIYCRPSDEVIHRYVGHHPQLRGVIPNIDRLIAAYDQMMEKIDSWGVRVITYNREASQYTLETLLYGDRA